MRRFLLAIFSALILSAASGATGPDATETWKEIEKLNRELGRKDAREEWKEGARAAHLHRMQQYLDYFIFQFPTAPQPLKARLIWLEAAPQIATGLQIPFDEEKWERELSRLEAETEIPAAMRADFEVGVITGLMRRHSRGEAKAEEMAKLAARMERFVAEFPRDRRRDFMAMTLGRLWSGIDEDRARQMLMLVSRASDPEMAAQAEKALAMLPFFHRPLDWEFTALDGRKVSLPALQGKIVVLDFWASWCPPCVAEMPEMVAISRLFAGRDVEIVGICLDSNRKKATEFLQAKGVTWPQYFDGNGWDTRLSRQFKITSIPAVVILGRDGRIVRSDARGDVSAVVSNLLQRPR